MFGHFPQLHGAASFSLDVTRLSVNALTGLLVMQVWLKILLASSLKPLRRVEKKQKQSIQGWLIKPYDVADIVHAV